MADISNRYFQGSTIQVESDGAVRTTEGDRSVRWIYKTSDTNILYVGKAHLGAATDAAVWSISEIDITNGSVKYASVCVYDQVWDDRESLSYA